MEEALDRVLARDERARVDSPSADSSLRDGYAVRCADLRPGGPGLPVCADVGAGDAPAPALAVGCAVRIYTGAALPPGADAVVPDEEVEVRGERLYVPSVPVPGTHVLGRGEDVRVGTPVARAGDVVRPALAGLLIAGGIDSVLAIPPPRVGLVSTGSEVVAPGVPLRPGQLYASNLGVLTGWLQRFGMSSERRLCPDDPVRLRGVVSELLPGVDLLVTSGGAWKSERDHTLAALEALGWTPHFREIRLAPGKAVAFGTLAGTPVLCLPGGPPANELTFLLLALPMLQKMAGRVRGAFPTAQVRLEAGLPGTPGWTRVHPLSLATRESETWARPTRPLGRMLGPAQTDALLLMEPDEEGFAEGSTVAALLLDDFTGAPGGPGEEE